MASGPTTFMTLSVFSAERFQGNPLAIVAVRGNSLTEKRKSLIAKEFGYSETIFLHDAPGPGLPRRLDIFTEQGEEIPFAGHPVIGAAHYLFSNIERMTYGGPRDRDTQQQTAVFATKAGNIPVFYNPYRQLAACTVPHAFHVHTTPLSMEDVLAVQPHLQIIPTYEEVKDKTFPVVSIVKGMTFALIDLTDAPEVLAGLKSRSDAPTAKLDQAWAPSFVGAMYYRRTGVTAQSTGEPAIIGLQCRMITQGMEDPGTGSASCALACFLATSSSSSTGASIETKGTKEGEELVSKTAELKIQEEKGERNDKKEDAAQATVKKEEKKNHLTHHIFAIEQGIEMGRKCTIAVEVDTKTVGASGKQQVKNVILSGRANFMLKGELIGN